MVDTVCLLTCERLMHSNFLEENNLPPYKEFYVMP